MDNLEQPELQNQVEPNKKTSKKKLVSFLILFLIIAILSGVISSYGFVRYFMKQGANPDGTPRITEKVTVEENSGVVEAVKKISPSVVSISTTSKALSFFGDVVEQKGGGTGFIVTNDGLILTNKHVVTGSSDLTVITNDGKDYKATVVATDPLFDFALVKIDAKNLPVVELGDSDQLDIGQKVIAIGNALGEYDNSVSVGVISGRARSITASDRSGGGTSHMEGLIQIDAPINPGNSGGPLVNISGQVIGINTAIDSQANSIGFALPINSAKVALNSYLKNGKITRPFMGVRYVNITREFAAANQLDVNSGALIVAGTGQGETLAIVTGGPADKAGLAEKDIITEINGEKITENKSVISILSSYNPGDKVEVKYLRKGEEKTTTVTLGEMK
ncbi:MAG: trypsin-like peptidase domain-containing protein [Patescibacteria group bacterium]|nr:trypsin-like peptidase domain-containing protein [Patescibacteria group bacterium]